MNLFQEQSHKLNQELKISAQQVKSLQILVLNQGELNTFIQKELEFNPVLETDEFKDEKDSKIKTPYTINLDKREYFLNSLIKQ